jgi:hypothetical protein
MTEIHFEYLGESLTASFVEILTTDKSSHYVFTLGNGKQAFLKKSVATEDLSAVEWSQEHYTEHEVWPAKLIEALGKAQQQDESKSAKL